MQRLFGFWRAILAEARGARGRLLIFTGSLAVGVAAVVGVSALVSAFRAGLVAESRTLLAADLKVSARRPLPTELDTLLAEIPHRRADLRELAALASKGDQSRLVELKACGDGYPFFGALTSDPAGLTVEALGAEGALLAPQLGEELGLVRGDRLEVGGASFELRGWLLDEPDRLEFQMALGPRILIGPGGFERTDLALAESRIKYSALFAFEPPLSNPALADLKQRLVAELPDAAYLNLQTHEEAQPSLQRSLGQVADFLGLVALLSLLLGGIGVAEVVRAWLADRTQHVAVLRALGLTAREIAWVYLGNVALLALLGCLLGGALGLALPFLVQPLAPDLFRGGAGVLFQPKALVEGFSLGLGVALLFSLWPLASVWRVSPLSALRAEAGTLSVPLPVRLGVPALLVLGLLSSARIAGGSWLWAASFCGGVVLLVALLALAAQGIALAVGRLPRARLAPTLAHGLAALSRPGSGTAGATVALGLGVMVVLAMVLIQGGLVRGLKEALPRDAPSLFLLDVQPDQWAGVRAELQARGAQAIASQPVVMARLRSIDGRAVAEIARERGDQGRSAWMLSREQRLTYGPELPADNRLVAGALWSDPTVHEVSLEQDYAADLGAKLGSVLRFDVQGVPIELTVTSLRSVRWESFGINFFMVVEPGVLEEAPRFELAAARLGSEADELAFQTSIAKRFPNVTVLRVRPLLEKLAGVTARIAAGVGALGSFTAVTGILILIGAVAAGAGRRGREAALLKVLGVTRAGVRRLFALEYLAIGALAGALGIAAAYLLAWAFLSRAPTDTLHLSPWAGPIAMGITCLLATLSGLAASQKALAAKPRTTLAG